MRIDFLLRSESCVAMHANPFGAPIMKRICGVWLSTLALLLAAGCGEAPLPAGNRETVIVIAEGTTVEVRKELGLRLHTAIVEGSPGDVIHVVAAPQHEPVASLVIPDAPPASRLRRSSLRAQLAEIIAFLEKEPIEGSDQLQVPAIAAAVNSLRRTDAPCSVILVGSPVFADPRHVGWSFSDGGVASDGALNNEFSPFSKGVSDFPAGTRVTWLAPTTDFGKDATHRAAITRFWLLFFASHGAELVRLSSDAAVCLPVSSSSQFSDQLTPRDEPACMIAAAMTTPADERVAGETVVRFKAMKPVTPAVKSAPAETTEPLPNKQTKDLPTATAPDLSLMPGSMERVAILVDRSLSMTVGVDQQEDLREQDAAVIADVQDKLRTLPCEEFFVLGFGGEAEDSEVENLRPYPWYWINPSWVATTPAHREAACEAVATWETSGGTPTLPAMKEVLKLEGLTMVILYTDGMPTLGGSQAELLSLLQGKGVVVNTIGVGRLSAAKPDDFDMAGGEFLQRLASSTGGRFFSFGAEADRDE